jgi:hypothetical protein
MTFTDAQFMSADDKRKLLKAWTTFVSHGFQRRHFTNRIYKHLSLHCGHIAHFNIDGFYSTWFVHGAARREFMAYFLGYRVLPDYEDVQEELKQVLARAVPELEAQATRDEVADLEAARDAINKRLAVLGG